MATDSHKSTPLKLWQERSMKGYVTQLREVTEQNALALAGRLGFAHHLLADGYALLLLSPVSRHDFLWRDTTRFSAGWVKERVYFKEKNRLGWSDEYVQRGTRIDSASTKATDTKAKIHGTLLGGTGKAIERK